MKLPTIAALWMEGPLSYLEQLCLKSFVDAGHRVVLYHYGPLQNVPDGIELADASPILPRTDFLTHQRTGSPALHSDLFRYKMLAQSENTIWADTDAYCMKPFETPNGHFYGWESSKHINGGVLGLPQDSETLRALLEFTSDEFAIPSWYGKEYQQELEAARDAGQPVHASEQPWGVWGPHAVTHFLHETGEARFALPQEGLYPFTFKDRRKMLRRNFDVSPYITDNTFSVHLYGRRMRARLVEREGGVPHPKSLLGTLLKKHDVDPLKAPIPAKPKPAGVAPVQTIEKVGRGQVNLTDLADRLELDRGSSKHRYTELYQLLLLQYRNRKIEFMEIGQEAMASPEQGHADGAEVPSVQMWLEYFPKGQVSRLVHGEEAVFADDRRAQMACRLEDRASIKAAVPLNSKFDVIIDDATQASHHQQNAFLELFPKIKSGGIYIIEDLRWQPNKLEISGVTKTSELFESYRKTGVFEHSDKDIADAFNALRVDFSGCFMFQVDFDKSKRNQLLVVHKR
ncbi:hypothetical protein [Shimia sp. MMG029]|uniref:hypothetical protein n=1 Tax=Shimia sp. MMG029 TaxID=3021978 RepID=UPI0022FF4106|nr:hypothetical protein [Shimia sp. MMG029]MDA5558632.1 hypothetical protein [Shimia sp. MMG029]